jgi:hypothetical protein
MARLTDFHRQQRVRLFEPRAWATRGSSLLGKGPGHLMPAVVATVMRGERTFSGAAAARDVGGQT